MQRAVTAAGGEIAHADLMDRLADHRDVRERLDALVQSGALVASVTAQPAGAPVLTYRLPPTPAPGAQLGPVVQPPAPQS